MKKFYSYIKHGGIAAPLANGTQSKYFKIREFRNQNHAIDEIAIDDRTTSLLESVRVKFVSPVFVQVANRNEPTASYHNPLFGDSTASDIDIGDFDLGTVDYEMACRHLEKIGARGIGMYDYVDKKGFHVRFIHVDHRDTNKSFWRCHKLDKYGNQVLEKISTFLLPYPIPARNLYWIKRIYFFRIKGDDVRWLQSALNMTKLMPDIKVDGDFASATDKYVREFQSKMGLTVDGNAGKITVNRLRDLLIL